MNPDCETERSNRTDNFLFYSLVNFPIHRLMLVHGTATESLSQFMIVFEKEKILSVKTENCFLVVFISEILFE